MKNAKTITVGVWLELGIGAPFSHEGLTRLLFFIAEGMPKDAVNFVLTVPAWMEDHLRSALKNLKEDDRDKFDVYVPVSRAAVSLRLLNLLSTKKNGKLDGWSNRMRLMAKKFSICYLKLLLSRTSYLQLILIAVISLPALFACFVLFCLSSGLEKINKFALSSLQGGLSYLKRFHGSIYTIALQSEFDAMAKMANKNNKIDCWFILNPFSTTAGKKLKAPVVALVADFVPLACPSGFSASAVDIFRKRLIDLDPVVTKYITISRHVAQDQLAGHLGVSDDRIKMIHHGAVSLKNDLSFEVLDNKSYKSRSAAACIIREYISSRSFSKVHFAEGWLDEVWDRYLENFPFEDVKFIMISTQNRQYKNSLSVIKAVELLIKSHGYGIKLIMTGALDNEMQSYVRDKSLFFDVISIPRVPNHVLAALYHCATVAVHASFFEGGIGAFPFYEAVSVGTPVILSKNAATLELTSDERYRDFLFDPYSVEELADRIKFVAENSEGTFFWQKKLYDEIANRSWSHASAEYLDVFRSAVKLN